jgi:anti-sigma regulatory factor (Ser/Thr protein kinase)
MPSRESQSDRLRLDVAGPTALGDAVAAARRFGLDQGLGERDQARLSIIVEELVTNLCEHGLCDLDHRIGLELNCRDSLIEVALEDNGPPFDPRNVDDEREIPSRGGGAGLRLVNSWSSIAGYNSANGRNRLELELRLSGS